MTVNHGVAGSSPARGAEIKHRKVLFYYMNFSVYILFSSKLNRFYTGTTDNVERRLVEHNTGSHIDAFTNKGVPWTLFLVIGGLSSGQAYKIERHIKAMKSKKYIENLAEYNDMVEKLKEKYR